MSVELVVVLAGAAASLVAGTLIPLVERAADHLPPRAQRFLQRIGIFKEDGDISYQAKVKTSLASLEAASKQVDEVVLQVSKLAKERETTVTGLEEKLSSLTRREHELKSKIEKLEQVPIEAVRHFEEMLKKEQKLSALREYILFGSGVVVSTAIAVVLKLLGY